MEAPGAAAERVFINVALGALPILKELDVVNERDVYLVAVRRWNAPWLPHAALEVTGRGGRPVGRPLLW